MARERRRGSARTSRKSGEGTSGGGNRGLIRGEQGRKRVDTEIERAKAKREARQAQMNAPFRFWMKPGTSREVIIVDESPEVFVFEHEIYNKATKERIYTGCVSEWETCPVCESEGKDPYYALLLTVIDLNEFRDRNNNVHEFSRKLFVVKSGQQKKIIRRYKKAEEDGGTLRGWVVELSRDGDKDPVIGNDMEFIEQIPEEELTDYVRTYKDKEGKEHEEECSEPYNYEELFPEPDAETLRAIVGGDSAAGSRRQSRKELWEDSKGEDGWDKDDGDETPWDEDEDKKDGKSSSRRSARGSSRRGRKNEEPKQESRSSRRPRPRGGRSGGDDDKPRGSSRRTRRTSR